MIYGLGTFVLNLLTVHCMGRRNPFRFYLMQAYQRETLWLKVGGKNKRGKDSAKEKLGKHKSYTNNEVKNASLGLVQDLG